MFSRRSRCGVPHARGPHVLPLRGPSLCCKTRGSEIQFGHSKVLILKRVRPETRGLCWTWGPPGQACTSVLRSDGSVYPMPCPLCAGLLPLQLALSWFAHLTAPHVAGSRAAQSNSLHGCLGWPIRWGAGPGSPSLTQAGPHMHWYNLPRGAAHECQEGLVARKKFSCLRKKRMLGPGLGGRSLIQPGKV